MTMTLFFDILLISALLLVSRRLLGASDLFQATVLFISFGLFLSLAWIRLQAPDIALAEAAVGAGLAGVLLFGTFKALEPDLDESELPAQPEPCRLDRAAACPSKLQVLLAGLFVGMITLLLVLAVLELPDSGNGLTRLAGGSLEQSGVQHPVTAVLLNFRLYDTWLELGVLLLALLGVLGMQGGIEPAKLPQPGRPTPVLRWLVRIMIPLMALAAVYLLWLGDHAPGGAFQAGVVLAAALALLWLAGHEPLRRLPLSAWRLCLIAGFAAMLLLAVLTTLLPGSAPLAFPQGRAKTLILLLEAAATLSIGVTLVSLAVLVLAGRKQRQAPDDG